MTSEQCCLPAKKGRSGLVPGMLYGLLPHSFCIGFILASIIGVTAATSFFKRLLLVPEFFQILVALSLIFATISAIFYLKKCGQANWQGIKSKWKYLTVLYATTIGINMLMFMVILPLLASRQSWTTKGVLSAGQSQVLNLKVSIPCPGHAPLIIEELGKIRGIGAIEFRFPNMFEVSFDDRIASQEQIINLEVFRTYPAKII